MQRNAFLLQKLHFDLLWRRSLTCLWAAYCYWYYERRILLSILKNLSWHPLPASQAIVNKQESANAKWILILKYSCSSNCKNVYLTMRKSINVMSKGCSFNNAKPTFPFSAIVTIQPLHSNNRFITFCIAKLSSTMSTRHAFFAVSFELSNTEDLQLSSALSCILCCQLLALFGSGDILDRNKYPWTLILISI